MADKLETEGKSLLKEMQGKELSEENLEKYSKKLSAVFAEASKSGKAGKDVFGITPQVMEGFYTHAYNLYNQGKYLEASHLFRVLIMLDGECFKYVLGLAACLHMTKHWLEAAMIYSMASLLDPSSPLPYYHASDCYLNGDQIKQAAVSLEMCIEAAGDNETFKLLKKRAQMTLDNLLEQISEEDGGRRKTSEKAKIKKKSKKKK